MYQTIDDTIHADSYWAGYFSGYDAAVSDREQYAPNSQFFDEPDDYGWTLDDLKYEWQLFKMYHEKRAIHIQETREVLEESKAIVGRLYAIDNGLARESYWDPWEQEFDYERLKDDLVENLLFLWTVGDNYGTPIGDIYVSEILGHAEKVLGKGKAEELEDRFNFTSPSPATINYLDPNPISVFDYDSSGSPYLN